LMKEPFFRTAGPSRRLVSVIATLVQLSNVDVLTVLRLTPRVSEG